jgi:Na+-transporting NADH:ubiquinone oxidoreductase subunit NqrC
MTTITLTLFLVLGIVSLFLISAIFHIHKLQQQVNLLDKEQHTQNNEIAVLMRNHLKHQEMLLQHIEILKYLVEQDPKLNSGKMYFTGPIGEA